MFWVVCCYRRVVICLVVVFVDWGFCFVIKWLFVMIFDVNGSNVFL